jgi:four helix bundle protein
VRIFDLEDRTTRFAKSVVKLCRMLLRDPVNDRIIRQVVGSAGSIGANYREANDAIGRKDFLMRMRITRREAKETEHWLGLLCEANHGREQEIASLLKEAKELRLIFSSILNKSR